MLVTQTLWSGRPRRGRPGRLGRERRDGLRAASSATDWLPPIARTGASLTAVTVIVNVWVALWFAPVPELTRRTVTVATPLALAAGV